MISAPPRVVALGAGVAGLEAAFLLARRLSGYLLMQFAAGEPFQAWPGRRSMDFGVHGVHAMAGML